MLNSPIASSLATQAWIDSKIILERQISILGFADFSDRAVAVKEFRYIMGGTVLLFHCSVWITDLESLFRYGSVCLGKNCTVI